VHEDGVRVITPMPPTPVAAGAMAKALLERNAELGTLQSPCADGRG
jgi:hypothetical protein